MSGAGCSGLDARWELGWAVHTAVGEGTALQPRAGCAAGAGGEGWEGELGGRW